MRDKLVLLGAGGHAAVVLDILLEMDEYEIVGILDPSYRASKQLLRVPLIGDDTMLGKLRGDGVTYAFVGLGNNSLRKKLFERCVEIGFSMANAISSHSVVSRYASLGSGNAVMPGAVVNVNVCLGDNCIVNTNASVDHDCKIGNHSHIAPGCALSGTVSVGEGCFLGTGTSIKDQISIGAWTVVGAGAAVVRDLPERVVATGVPATIKRQL